MNHHITPTRLAAVLPACNAIAASRGRTPSEKYELEDEVLRGNGWAEPNIAEAGALHVQIDAILAAKKTADEAITALPPTKESLKERIAQRRWEEETKGTTVDFGDGRTLAISTDANSQSKLTGLLVVSSMQPNLSVRWKGNDGKFQTISASDVPVMAGTVLAHVQACFSRESALLDLLEATNDTKAFVATIDAFWEKV